MTKASKYTIYAEKGYEPIVKIGDVILTKTEVSHIINVMISEENKNNVKKESDD